MVELTYIPCYSQEQYTELFAKCSDDRETYDFVECLAYSHDTAVVMTGKMVDYKSLLTRPFSYNPIGLWFKPWFYQHVEGFLSKGNGEYVELLPLRDYYHRHTRSIFWVIFDQK